MYQPILDCVNTLLTVKLGPDDMFQDWIDAGDQGAVDCRDE